MLADQPRTLAWSRDTEDMHTVYIGMGSNIASPAGSPEATMAAAVARLGSLGRVVARSSLYSTAPVGYADQPQFVNAVVALETELTPRALLRGLLGIEQEFGRDRAAGIRNGPRTLDLDILVFGDTRINEAGLEIPHPRIAERAFVVVPLAELASKDEAASRSEVIIGLLRKFRERFPETTHAVVPLQSALWRAGSRGDPFRPGDDFCEGTGASDADG